MEKLELKHVAPYIPYNLKVIFGGHGNPLNVTGAGLSGIKLINNANGDFGWGDFCDCKPILRPLSDLAKEIEHDGERFVPIEELSKFTTTELNSDGEIESAEFDGEMRVTKMPDDMDYYRIQKLFEWHFDVFDLHSKGLCVYYGDIK